MNLKSSSDVGDLLRHNCIICSPNNKNSNTITIPDLIKVYMKSVDKKLDILSTVQESLRLTQSSIVEVKSELPKIMELNANMSAKFDELKSNIDVVSKAQIEVEERSLKTVCV